MLNLPFWLPRKDMVVWYLVFIGFFLLALDYWNWWKAYPLLWGIPFWVLYLLALTISLSLAFYVFSRLVWRDED